MVRLAANLSFFFKELPFLERFGAAASCGFRAVEFMFAGDGGFRCEAHEVREQLDQHSLSQALFNARAGDWEAGERGTGGLPGRDSDFRASIDHALEFATVVGCPRVHVMAGLMDQGAKKDIFVERLRWASEHAAGSGVTLCIEPLNAADFPGYLVPDTTTALQIIEEVGSDHCKLQLDLYHYAMTHPGEDMEAAIRTLLPKSAHVQLANPPGRNEPGVGDVHFPPLLALLGDLGYSGYVGCEYKPSTASTTESLAWARAYGIAS
jgi:hydroxypyruvate isomerase